MLKFEKFEVDEFGFFVRLFRRRVDMMEKEDEDDKLGDEFEVFEEVVEII